MPLQDQVLLSERIIEASSPQLDPGDALKPDELDDTNRRWCASIALTESKKNAERRFGRQSSPNPTRPPTVMRKGTGTGTLPPGCSSPARGTTAGAKRAIRCRSAWTSCRRFRLRSQSLRRRGPRPARRRSRAEGRLTIFAIRPSKTTLTSRFKRSFAGLNASRGGGLPPQGWVVLKGDSENDRQCS